VQLSQAHRLTSVVPQARACVVTAANIAVMAGLVPAIHPSANSAARGILDPRDKPEDDKCGEVIA
jgi:hypothetical protein